MFGKKRTPPAQAGGVAAEPSAGDRATDALAELLRTLGEFSFDTAELEARDARERFDAWARHLLVGSPPPGIESSAEGVRDWPGLARFAREQRREESAYVVRSLGDLRDALWMFIQGVGRAIPADQAMDSSVGEELTKLRSCIDSNDTEEIRRVAIASTNAIEAAIHERGERSRRQLEQLADQIDRFSSELVEAKQQLEQDSLTRLYNRGAFDEFLDKMVNLARLSACRSTLFMIDVDDFKWVNDHFGHPAGDAVLKEVAASLSQGFSRRGDFVARYGGDEFAAIAQTNDESVDAELGEGALLRVRDLEVPCGEERIKVTLSIGSARGMPGEDAASWLSRADSALYESKQAGRDRYTAFREHRD